MAHVDLPPFVSRLQYLRDANQWSIAEMARRANLPKRSMENYFKGHKPGLDALISMSRGFGVPVDFLVGFNPPSGGQLDMMVYEAAYPTILSVLRRISTYVAQGRTVFQEPGLVFSVPIDQCADEEAREVVRRFASMAKHMASE